MSYYGTTVGEFRNRLRELVQDGYASGISMDIEPALLAEAESLAMCVRAVVNQYIDDERKHYQENKTNDHIYLALERLQEALPLEESPCVGEASNFPAISM